MKLTKTTELLISFFVKKKCIDNIVQTNKTDLLLEKLYNEIDIATDYINSLKDSQGQAFYNLTIKEIKNANQIPKSFLMSGSSFPNEVKQHIAKKTVFELTYQFALLDKKFKFVFLIEDTKNIRKYNSYVDNMLVWLTIISKVASKSCSKELTVYLFFTSMKKELPTAKNMILNANNINTAFTTTCPVISEIIIFRKEEWFKVFLHETFHNFALDFSNMNVTNVHKKVLELFSVNSEVNLFEAYTEFWARIMNTVFCSYMNLKDKKDIEEFLINTEFFINFERIYAFFQMTKVLDYMGLRYEDLIKKDKASELLRNSLYKEDTNVLSYFVITTILLNNYQLFLSWCNNHNSPVYLFNHTNKSLNDFVNFIYGSYKIPSFIKNVKCTQRLLENLKHDSKKNIETKFILNNLRMSVCELG
jgi:hypothetical protein